MGKSKKIAISLPAELLKEAERERRSRNQSRSEFFRNAVEEHLRREQERQADERYMQSYRDHPESAAEGRAFRSHAKKVFRELPWE